MYSSKTSQKSERGIISRLVNLTVFMWSIQTLINFELAYQSGYHNNCICFCYQGLTSTPENIRERWSQFGKNDFTVRPLKSYFRLVVEYILSDIPLIIIIVTAIIALGLSFYSEPPQPVLPGDTPFKIDETLLGMYVYVPGFYIALQCVLTPHSALQAVCFAGEWSVRLHVVCRQSLFRGWIVGADCSRIAIQTLVFSKLCVSVNNCKLGLFSIYN